MADPSSFPKAMASESAPDPPPSSASSKRRWSPCTWRYAIEEGQPELGSKPRASYILSPPSSTPRDRERLSEPPKKPSSPEKAGGVNRDQIPVEQSSSRQSAENGGAYKKQGQRHSDEMHDGARKSTNQKKVTELHEERRRRRKKKEISRRREENEGHSGDASKRRKRELTPSELYFCEVCAARVSNGYGSPVGDCC